MPGTVATIQSPSADPTFERAATSEVTAKLVAGATHPPPGQVALQAGLRARASVARTNPPRP